MKNVAELTKRLYPNTCCCLKISCNYGGYSATHNLSHVKRRYIPCLIFLFYKQEHYRSSLCIENICLTSVTRAKPKEKVAFPA